MARLTPITLTTERRLRPVNISPTPTSHHCRPDFTVCRTTSCRPLVSSPKPAYKTRRESSTLGALEPSSHINLVRLGWMGGRAPFGPEAPSVARAQTTGQAMYEAGRTAKIQSTSSPEESPNRIISSQAQSPLDPSQGRGTRALQNCSRLSPKRRLQSCLTCSSPTVSCLTQISNLALLIDPVQCHMPLIYREFHTAELVFQRSQFLCTVYVSICRSSGAKTDRGRICAIAARFYTNKPGLHSSLSGFAKRLAFEVPSRGYKSVEVVQAYLLLTLWTLGPEKT